MDIFSLLGFMPFGVTVAGTIGYLVLAGVAAYGGTQLAKGGGKGKAPKVIEMPEAPKLEDASGAALKSSRYKGKQRRRSQSIYTSPLGIAGEADIARKTLTGQ